MVGNIIVDFTTATVVNDDGDNDNVSFTLSWNEPFANFDPIVNYNVTINCTDNATCPVIVDTDNVTRTADVNFITDLSMMTTLSVTATNTIGASDPAVSIITGMYASSYISYIIIFIYVPSATHMYIHMFVVSKLI